jgi:hypothetical protein
MGVAMTTAQRSQLKGLRGSFGDDVDKIDVELLLSAMKGLRGQNKKAKFEELLREVDNGTTRVDDSETNGTSGSKCNVIVEFKQAHNYKQFDVSHINFGEAA